MQVVFTLVFPSVNQSLVLRALELGGMEFLAQGLQHPNVFSVVLPVEGPSFTVNSEGKRNRLD